MSRRSHIATVTLLVAGALLGWWTVSRQSPAVAQERSPAKAGPARLDRTALPIPEPQLKPITELDARNATAPPRFQVKAPAGAPNVLIVLIDDMGFGQSSAFGGPIHMPTVELN